MPHTSQYKPESQIVCNQLASSYVLFALIEALVLRSTDDLKVWRAVVLALLVCDVGHIYAVWIEMSTHGLIFPWLWLQRDATTMLMSFMPFLLRAGFLLDVGFDIDVRRKRI
jgi:hypothetical protein